MDVCACGLAAGGTASWKVCAHMYVYVFVCMSLPLVRRMCMCVCIYMYIYIHTYIYIHIYIYIYMDVCVCVPAATTHACRKVMTHPHQLAHTHIHTRIYRITLKDLLEVDEMNAECTRLTHACIHTYIHMYTGLLCQIY